MKHTQSADSLPVSARRRSAVERQACQTVAALGAALKNRFQAAAAHLLPVLFTMLVMSIQVGP